MFCKYKIFSPFFSRANKKKPEKRLFSDLDGTRAGQSPPQKTTELTLGRYRIGKTVGPIITDIILDGNPLDVIDVPPADQDRVIL